MQFFVPHELVYFLIRKFNLYSPASVLKFFNVIFHCSLHFRHFSNKSNQVQYIGQVFVYIHIFGRVIFFCQIPQSIIFRILLLSVYFLMLNPEPFVVAYEFLDEFLTNLIIFLVKFDDFLMIEVHVNWIFFVASWILAIDNYFGVHGVFFFREFLIDL